MTALPEEVRIESGLLEVSAAEQEELYSVGYRIGLGGTNGPGWSDLPPENTPSEQTLPRTGTGKVLKKELRKKYWSGTESIRPEFATKK